MGTGTHSKGKEGIRCPHQLKVLLKTCMSKDTLRALDIEVVET